MLCPAKWRDRKHVPNTCRIDRQRFLCTVAPVPQPDHYTTGVSRGGVRNDQVQTFSEIIEMFVFVFLNRLQPVYYNKQIR